MYVTKWAEEDKKKMSGSQRFLQKFRKLLTKRILNCSKASYKKFLAD